MKKLFALSMLAAAFAVFTVQAPAQTATSSTTLGAALIAPSLNTVDVAYDTVIVASSTGMSSQTALGATQTFLFIDKERMPVVTVVNSTTVIVYRGNPVGPGGATSTPAAHVSGAIVWFGPGTIFVSGDPSGACTAANYPYLPVISSVSGAGYNCLSTGQWVQQFIGGDSPRAQNLTQFCTGTAGSAETEFLNGAACSGATTATARLVMVQPGTLYFLRLFSSAVVVGGTGKDVLTVMKNGSATTLTCTVTAAAATCSDTTHSVAVAAGDVITFRFVSATSDTAANVSVGVLKY